MKRPLFLTAALAVGAAGIFAGASLAQPGGRGPHGQDGPMRHHERGAGVMGQLLHAADANDDKSVTRAEVDELRAEMFDWMDRNGDGVLDDQDRSPIHRRLAAKSDGDDVQFGRRHRRGPHAEMDANDDGRIERAEFLGMATAMFDELDANDDDVVSPDEIESAHDSHRKKRQWWRED